jgi:hypothetical protein
LLCVVQLALAGCLGAGAYVEYRKTGDIPEPEILSRADRGTSRSLEYLRMRLPPPDRVEDEGRRTVVYYDRLKFIFGGPTLMISPGYPLGVFIPIPLGRAKAALTFEDGMLVGVRATTPQQVGLRFVYAVTEGSADVLAGTQPQVSRIGEYEVRTGAPRGAEVR